MKRAGSVDEVSRVSYSWRPTIVIHHGDRTCVRRWSFEHFRFRPLRVSSPHYIIPRLLAIYTNRGELRVFQKDKFIDDCKAAVGEGQKVIRELVLEAVTNPAGVIRELGEPTEAGVCPIYNDDDLTIINFIWAPYMTLMPHNHNMFAVIGIYGGREDNMFWRRVGDALTTCLVLKRRAPTQWGRGKSRRWEKTSFIPSQIPFRNHQRDPCLRWKLLQAACTAQPMEPRNIGRRTLGYGSNACDLPRGGIRYDAGVAAGA